MESGPEQPRLNRGEQECQLGFRAQDHREWDTYHLDSSMGTSGQMRVNLLDPGLLVMGGHHLEYDLRVVRELAARGIETNVYSHVQVSAEVRAAVTASAQLTALFRISRIGTGARSTCCLAK